MTDLSFQRLVQQLKAHEGTGPGKAGRLYPYYDTVGVLTIGHGRNLDAKGISLEEADLLLRHDIAEAQAGLKARLPWTLALDELRQRVLIDLCFNLGLDGLCQFKTTLKLLQQGRFGEAADALLDSKYATQVGARARRLAGMLRTGQDPWNGDPTAPEILRV